MTDGPRAREKLTAQALARIPPDGREAERRGVPGGAQGAAARGLPLRGSPPAARMEPIGSRWPEAGGHRVPPAPAQGQPHEVAGRSRSAPSRPTPCSRPPPAGPRPSSSRVFGRMWSRLSPRVRALCEARSHDRCDARSLTEAAPNEPRSCGSAPRSNRCGLRERRTAERLLPGAGLRRGADPRLARS